MGIEFHLLETSGCYLITCAATGVGRFRRNTDAQFQLRCL